MRFSKQVLASPLCALYSNVYSLIGFLVHQSIRSAVVTFLSMSIVAEIFSDEEMGALAGYWRRRQFFWTLCGP